MQRHAVLQEIVIRRIPLDGWWSPIHKPRS